MRFMNWSYDDLMGLPAAYIPVLFELIEDDARKQEDERFFQQTRHR